MNTTTTPPGCNRRFGSLLFNTDVFASLATICLLSLPAPDALAATVPDAPSITSVSAGPQSVTVHFNAPAYDGGLPVTSFTASCGGTTQQSGNSSPIVVERVPSGVATVCTVRAGNGMGLGAPSAPSASVSPLQVNATLYFQSQTGDYIGGGRTILIGPADGFIFSTNSYSANQYSYTNGVAVSFVAPNSNYSSPLGYSYSLTIVGPDYQRPQVGNYPVATRWPFQAAGVAGLDFSANSSGCNMSSGNFQIIELTYDANDKVTSLAMNFEQHCEGVKPALFGQIRYNSTVPIDTAHRHILPIDFPAIKDAALGSLVTSNPALINGIDVSLPISIVGGEYSINNGAFTSDPGTVVNGQSVRLRVTSAAAENSLVSATVDIGGAKATFNVGTLSGSNPQPNGDPLLVVIGQPILLTGEAVTKVYSPATLANIQFTQATQPHEVRISQGESYYAHNLSFYGPGGMPLAVGIYENAKYSWSSTTAQFSASGNIACGNYYDSNTRVVVHEIEYLPSGAPSRIALDYVQFCRLTSGGNYSYAYGYLRINSSRAIDYTMPYPVPFVFPMVTNAPLGTSVTSATAKVVGVNVPVAVSIAGGEYSVDGGPFTNTAGSVVNGQAIRVRRDSATTPNTATTATLALGNLSVPFNIGTAVGTLPQPNNGALVALTGYSKNVTTPIVTKLITPAIGGSVTIAKDPYSGGYGPIMVSGVDASASSGWSVYLSGPSGGALAPGVYTDALRYVTSSAARFSASGGPDCSYSDLNKTRFVVHEVEYGLDGTPLKLAIDFVQRCDPSDSYYASNSDVIGFVRVNSTVPVSHIITLPAPFSFPSAVGVAPGAQIVSAEAVVQGITATVPISVIGGEYSVDGGAFVSSPGTIAAGQRVRVRVMASAQANAVASASLTVGDRTVTFLVGTSAGAAPQATGAPLLVLVGATADAGLKPIAVISPASFAAFTATAPSYPSLFGGIQVTQINPQSSGSWQLALHGPNRSALTPGSYTGATVDGYSTVLPYFWSYASNGSTSLPYPSCSSNYVGSTDFTVHEVEYSVSGAILKLALDFHQQCTGYSDNEIVHGYLRFNSTVAIDYALRKPLPFALPMVTGAAPTTAVESSEVTVKGINVPVPISISGGLYSIDGSSYTNAPGTISSGQKLKVQAVSSAQYNAVTTAHLEVGERSADFKVGTAAGPNPQANGSPLIYLLSQGSEPFGYGQTYLYSPATDTAILVGRNGTSVTLSTTLPISYTYYQNSWSFTFSSPNASLLTPGTYSTIASSPVAPSTAGFSITRNGSTGYCAGIAGQFTIHEIAYTATGVDKLAIDFVHYCGTNTSPLYGYLRFNSTVPVNAIADTVPGPFGFQGLNNAARSTSFTTTSITPTGYTSPAPISVTGGEYSIDNGAFTSASGTLNPGQSVRLRQTSSAMYGVSTSVNLSVGGIVGSFTVTTEYLDTYPSSFTFGFQANVPLNQWINSPVITPVGFNGPLVVTINGGEFSVGGRPFTSAPSGIQPGETIQVRLMSSTAYYDYRVSLLTIGNTTGQFSIQTVAQVGLTVSVNGPGSVSSSPAGINCTGVCSAEFLYGTVVTLVASPASGQQFAGWSGGGCTGTGACTLTINAAQAVTAMFANAPPYAPIITSAVPGNGQATLTFAVTPVSGAAPITGYTATCSGITKSAPASPITLTGLANDVIHTCNVFATNSAGPGPASASVNVTPSASIATALIGVQSRKTHGAAGVFDLPVNVNEPVAGAVTVEPRSMGAGHLVVFQFNTNVTAANYTVFDGNGVAIAPTSFTTTGNEVSLLFTTLADKSRLAITLTGVNGTLNSSASIGFLVGDVNGSRAVTSGDTSAVKSRSGWVVDGTNFIFNVGTSGIIGAGDIAAVKARVGNVLP